MSTRKQKEEYCDKLLTRFKQDPQYDLKLEFGRMLMRDITTYSHQEMLRYDELKELLNLKYEESYKSR